MTYGDLVTDNDPPRVAYGMLHDTTRQPSDPYTYPRFTLRGLLRAIFRRT